MPQNNFLQKRHTECEATNRVRARGRGCYPDFRAPVLEKINYQMAFLTIPRHFSRKTSSERKMQILLRNLCLNDKLFLNSKTTRNHCIKIFQIQNNKKSLYKLILTFLPLSPKHYFHLILPNSNSKFKVKQITA